jgi:glycosyltransferase involved in cell wall biosynthesis
MISILIPTINNTDCLKLCINYLEKHTQTPYEILIFNNGCDAESTNFIDELPYKSLKSSYNAGVSKAYNQLAKIARGEYLLLWDDDKLAQPNWDANILPLIEAEGEFGWKSLVEIWPYDTNPCSMQYDFGKSPTELQEDKLLAFSSNLRFPRKVSLSVSQLMTKKLFDAIGGYDEKFYPGFGSDPDIMWRSFCFLGKDPKRFLNANGSFYYHFTSATTNRIFRYKLITNALRAYGHIMFFAKHGFLVRQLRNRTGHGLLESSLK